MFFEFPILKEGIMRLFRVVFFFIMILLTAAVLFAANDPHVIQARIHVDNKDQWLQLRGMHLDEVGQGGDYMEIITDRKELTSLQSQGFKATIIHDDVAAFYRSRMPDKAMGAYKNLADIDHYLDTLIANHPTIVSAKVNLGMTNNFNFQYAVKISNSPNADNGKPEVLYTACIHAREVITPEVLINVINYLVRNYGSNPDVTSLVDNRQLWFVLVVNPDGYVYNEITNPSGNGMWRKNRRDNGDGTFGVDLNRNYGYAWGFDNSGSSPVTNDETYRGPSAFSELETQHMRDFQLAHNFIFTLYFHSYANLVMWPWGYQTAIPPDQLIMSSICDSMATMNLYTSEQSCTLYLTNGDSDDWGYGEQALKPKSFSFTIEVGNDNDGFWPAPSRIPQLVSENLAPCIFLAQAAGHVYQVLPPNPPSLTVADTVQSSGYDVVWSLHDTLNPAIQYELTELTDYKISTDSAASMSNWVNKGFSISTARSSSVPSSFYSGQGNSLIRYVQTNYPYHVPANDTMKFRVWYNTEPDWDYGYVEVSLDGVIFSPIPGSITTTTNLHGQNRGNGYTGNSSGWVDARFPLNAFSGQDIYLRLSYYTDQAVYNEGIYLDNIRPVPLFGTTNIYSPLTDTTEHFTGFGGGDYYYKVRGRDADNQWSSYSNLAKTFVVRSYVCGDANHDTKINIGDAVYMINFVFKSGPAPTPLQAGDANCDGSRNVGDAVYLINYVFKGGTAPCCP
jgi:hypothetical protein